MINWPLIKTRARIAARIMTGDLLPVDPRVRVIVCTGDGLPLVDMSLAGLYRQARLSGKPGSRHSVFHGPRLAVLIDWEGQRDIAEATQ